MTTESNNITIETKKKRIRKTKKEQFYNEQLTIINKLNVILNITEKNNAFILDDIKHNEHIQKQILDLVPEVKLYFAYTKWAYFLKPLENGWLSLLRSIYKAHDYNLTYKQKMKNGEKYTEYYINKNL